MIPATANYTALYIHKDPQGAKSLTYKPVIGWDDEGRPLVVAEKTGRLVPADFYGNFEHVEEAGSRDFVTAVPGGGWLCKRVDGGTEPVVAWMIRADGTGVAMVSDSSDGTADDFTVYADGRIYHPDEVQDPGASGDKAAVEWLKAFE